MLDKYVCAVGDNAVKSLEEMFKNLNNEESVAKKAEIVYNTLDFSVRDLGPALNNEVSDKLDEAAYDRYFTGKRNKTSEEVRNEIHADLDILRNVLQDSVVNAIQLEKPFLALEIQTINALSKSLSGEPFRTFVVQHAQQIAVEQYAGIQEAEQRRQTRENMMREIDGILRKMESTDNA